MKPTLTRLALPNYNNQLTAQKWTSKK